MRLLLLMLIMNSGLSFAQKSLPQEFIKYEFFGGEVDKPIPIVYFSTCKIPLEMMQYGVSYKISKKSFREIKRVIEQSTFSYKIDTSETKFSHFVIFDNGLNIYAADDADSVRSIFTSIETALKGSKILKSVSSHFSTIYSRIKLARRTRDILLGLINSPAISLQANSKYQCPMHKGKIVNTRSELEWGTFINQVEIESKKGNVMSSSTGIIIGINPSVNNRYSIGIESSDTVFIYDNLLTVNCIVGEKVKIGQNLGAIKKTEFLLFRIKKGGEYIDPRIILFCR